MKKLIEKIQNLINVHPDRNQRYILLSVAISGLLATYVNPVLIKAIITELPSQWLAFESLVMSLSELIIGILWRGAIRKGAIKRFSILAITESTLGFLVGVYLCFIEFNPWTYAIASLIYAAFISTFVGKCIMFFKSRLWTEHDREVYDNNSSIVIGIVCIVGYLLAIILSPPLKLALFLWAICCIVDDIGWIIVYIKNKQSLENTEEE